MTKNNSFSLFTFVTLRRLRQLLKKSKNLKHIAQNFDFPPFSNVYYYLLLTLFQHILH